MGQVRVCVRHPWKKYTFLFSGQFSPFIGAFFIYGTRSMPKVRGTADVGWRSLFPFRSILLVLTHDFIITCAYGPTGSDGHERKDADAALRTIFVPFEVKEVLYAWGPVQPAMQRFPYTNYLRLGW